MQQSEVGLRKRKKVSDLKLRNLRNYKLSPFNVIEDVCRVVATLYLAAFVEVHVTRKRKMSSPLLKIGIIAASSC